MQALEGGLAKIHVATLGGWRLFIIARHALHVWVVVLSTGGRDYPGLFLVPVGI